MEKSESSNDGNTSSLIWRQVRRVGAIALGVLLLIAGTVMLVIPGPGIAVIFGGLVLLSSEVPWARTLLRKLRAWVRTIMARLGLKKDQTEKEQ